MTRLSAPEREVVLTIADDEAAWHVFTDSSRLTRRILRIAARWGVTPERCGEGWEFILPLAAVRFSAPKRMSAAQREALRRGRHANQATLPQKALDNPGGSEGSKGAGVS